MFRDDHVLATPALQDAKFSETGSGTFAQEIVSNQMSAVHSGGTGQWNMVYIIPPQVRDIRAFHMRTRREGATTSLTFTCRRNGTLDLNASDIRPTANVTYEAKTLTPTLSYKPGDRLFIRIESTIGGGTDHNIDRFRILAAGTSNLKSARGVVLELAEAPNEAFGLGTLAHQADLAQSKIFSQHTGTGSAQAGTWRHSFLVPGDFRAMPSTAIYFRTYRSGAANVLTCTVFDSDGVADPSCNAKTILPVANVTYETFTSALTGNYRPHETFMVQFDSTVDDTEVTRARVDRLEYLK